MSLLTGVDEAVGRTLGIRSCNHRSVLKRFQPANLLDLAKTVYATIACNWSRAGCGGRLHRSRQNWRWCLQPQISARNRSPEVVLERAIAAACVRLGRDDWANQVPVASGLVEGAGDGRRAIDLMKRHGKGHYELIELKVGSNTPLSAAVEALGYTALWLLTRADPNAPRTELLSAARLDVSVLAPAHFYRGCDPGSLAEAINEGLRMLGTTKAVSLSFAYQVLPDDVLPGPHLGDAALLEQLARRTRLTAGSQ